MAVEGEDDSGPPVRSRIADGSRDERLVAHMKAIEDADSHAGGRKRVTDAVETGPGAHGGSGFRVRGSGKRIANSRHVSKHLPGCEGASLVHGDSGGFAIRVQE